MKEDTSSTKTLEEDIGALVGTPAPQPPQEPTQQSGGPDENQK